MIKRMKSWQVTVITIAVVALVIWAVYSYSYPKAASEISATSTAEVLVEVEI